MEDNIQVAEEIIIKDPKKTKQKNLCMVNNALFLIASVVILVALVFGVKASDGDMTVYNFYKYIVNMFKGGWDDVFVGLNKLADCGLAVAYIIICVKFFISIIISADNFSKICKKGYDANVEGRIKSTAGVGFKEYVILTVCSSLFYAQSLDIKNGLVLAFCLAVFIASDYIKTFYVTDKAINRTTVLYNIVKKVTVSVVYAMLYAYVLKLASIYSFVYGVKVISQIPGESTFIFAYALMLVVFPIVNIFVQFCFMTAISKSADFYLGEEDNFVGLLVSTGIACIVFMLGYMLATSEDTDNILTFTINVAGMQIYPVMLSLAGMLVYLAYKAALDDAKQKAIDERKRLVIIEEAKIKKEQDEKKLLEQRKASEDKAKLEVTKQIAAAIVQAQKEEQATKDAEEMSQIISAALKKLYIASDKTEGAKGSSATDDSSDTEIADS